MIDVTMIPTMFWDLQPHVLVLLLGAVFALTLALLAWMRGFALSLCIVPFRDDHKLAAGRLAVI